VARWRGRSAEPQIPDWIRHESDGGFAPSAWAEPGDFGLEPRLAVSRAEARWIAARTAWLLEHEDVAGILLEQVAGAGAPRSLKDWSSGFPCSDLLEWDTGLVDHWSVMPWVLGRSYASRPGAAVKEVMA
jgi:hypothetical protein